jgi:hypothetical protein
VTWRWVPHHIHAIHLFPSFWKRDLCANKIYLCHLLHQDSPIDFDVYKKCARKEQKLS